VRRGLFLPHATTMRATGGACHDATDGREGSARPSVALSPTACVDSAGCHTSAARVYVG
jgi:hypothetical protein